MTYITVSSVAMMILMLVLLWSFIEFQLENRKQR